jgi:hypothetical protein
MAFWAQREPAHAHAKQRGHQRVTDFVQRHARQQHHRIERGGQLDVAGE